MFKASVGDDQFVSGGEVSHSVDVMAFIAFRKVTKNVSSCVVTFPRGGVSISGNQRDITGGDSMDNAWELGVEIVRITPSIDGYREIH